MNPITITCPKCKEIVSIDEALTHQLENNIRKQLEGAQEEELKKVREQTEEEAKRKYWKIAQEKAEEKFKDQLSEQQKKLQDEIEKQAVELKKSREEQLKILNEKEQIIKEKESWELEKKKQLLEERDLIKKEMEESLMSRTKLEREQDKKAIEDLKKQLEDAHIKANMASQQLQGEVQELDLENLLQRAFPYDEIVPVAKGVNGADILHKVRDQSGRFCGVIVWESKRTKNWSEGWIQKLKDDMRNSKGDVAILVTNALPEGIKIFGNKDGVIISGYECLESLAYMVRLKIMDEYSAKQSVVGKNEKMEVTYNYLIGNEFRQKFEAIVLAFTSMKEDIEKERRVYMKLWEKREKQLERVIINTVGIHGDLQGLIGASLPEIKELEITALLEDGSDQETLFDDIKPIES